MKVTKQYLKYLKNKSYILEKSKTHVFLLSDLLVKELQLEINRENKTCFLDNTKFFIQLQEGIFPETFLLFKADDKFKEFPEIKLSEDKSEVVIAGDTFSVLSDLEPKSIEEITDEELAALEKKLEEEKKLELSSLSEEVKVDEELVPGNQDATKVTSKRMEEGFRRKFSDFFKKKNIPPKDELFTKIHAPKQGSEIISDISKNVFNKPSIDQKKQELEAQLEAKDRERRAAVQELISEIKHIDSEIKTPQEPNIHLEIENTKFPVDFSSNGSLWFSWQSVPSNTDTFWNHLILYYRTSPSELNTKLKDISAGFEEVPVFTSLRANLSTFDTYDDVKKKLMNEIDRLNVTNELLQDRLKTIEEEFSNQGISAEYSSEYVNLRAEQKELVGSIKRAELNLADFESKIKEFSEANNNLIPNFYINIFGKDALLSKYQEIIFDKYLDLNLQINEITASHRQLEKELLFRLKHLHDARKAQIRIQFREQQELFKEQRAKNDDLFTLLKDKGDQDSFRKLSEIHEITKDVQEKITEEKNKVQYYLDNLRNINEMESYEAKFFNLKKKKEEFAKKKEEFEQKLFALKYSVANRERKFSKFFHNIREDVFEFQSDILKTVSRNKTFVFKSFRNLWNIWYREALPIIDQIRRKKEEIIMQFAHIPYAKIMNLYHVIGDLWVKANTRQFDWTRIYDHIIGEFKRFGYECLVPKPSELEDKYIEELDVSKLRISKETKKILFPNPKFVLSNRSNMLFGLEPRVLDDDNFLVMDQVWSTLTDEQEYFLQEKLRIDKIYENEKDIAREFNAIKGQYDIFLNKCKKRLFKDELLVLEPKLPESQEDKDIRLEAIEQSQLRAWKEKFYSSSNTESKHKHNLFNLSKKLFSLSSAQMVNSEIVVTDTGLVENDQTEIYTQKDYFIKSPDSDLSSTEHPIDVQIEETDLHSEDSDDMIDLIHEIESSEHFMIEEVYPSPPPTLEELAQLSIKKYNEKRETFESDKLQEKFLSLNDEIKRISKYHQDQSDYLTKLVNDRGTLFDEMQIKLNNTKEFLIQKEDELEDMLRKMEEALDVKLMEVDKSSQIDKDNITYTIKNWLFRIFR